MTELKAWRYCTICGVELALAPMHGCGGTPSHCPYCGKSAHAGECSGSASLRSAEATSTDFAKLGTITRSEPIQAYGVRHCRGHWHVTLGGEDLQGDGISPQYETAEDALDAADKCNADWYSRSSPPSGTAAHSPELGLFQCELERCPSCDGNGSREKPFDGNCPANWAHGLLSYRERMALASPSADAGEEKPTAWLCGLRTDGGSSKYDILRGGEPKVGQPYQHDFLDWTIMSVEPLYLRPAPPETRTVDSGQLPPEGEPINDKLMRLANDMLGYRAKWERHLIMREEKWSSLDESLRANVHKNFAAARQEARAYEEVARGYRAARSAQEKTDGE